MSTLPQVARVLTDPADCGPVVLALPQDVQAEEFDFPAAMFAPRLHRVPRPRPDRAALADAAEAAARVRSGRCSSSAAACATRARQGGAGVRRDATASRSWRRRPVARWSRTTTGCTAARSASSAPPRPTPSPPSADVVLAVGTRLQDFTTASWTGFAPDVRLVTVNAARFDAVKHARSPSSATRASAGRAVRRLDGWSVDATWTASAASERAAWDAHVDGLRGGSRPTGR